MKLLAICLLLLMTAPLRAQTGVRPPQGWSLSVYGGGAAFTDFHRGMTRRIGPETSGAFAGTIAFWPTRHWGIRARAGYVPSRFETIILQADRDSTEQLASLDITSYEGQLMFRLPTIHGRIMPYGLLGGGVVNYSAGDDAPLPEEADDSFGSQAKPAVSAGFGAAIALRPRGWSLHFELTDQVSGTPLADSGPDHVRTTSTVSFLIGVSWNLLR